MILHHTAAGLLSQDGAFADIFIVDDESVAKLFRRQRLSHDPIDDPRDHDLVVKEVWDAECCAYEALGANPELAKYAPQFHGRIRVGEVLDANGGSIAAKYLLDCAYLMERIPGSACKIGLLDASLQGQVSQILSRFEEIGIRAVTDSSCFVPGARAECTIIDFATWDALADLGDCLAIDGRLPQRVRDRWSNIAAT